MKIRDRFDAFGWTLIRTGALIEQLSARDRTIRLQRSQLDEELRANQRRDYEEVKRNQDRDRDFIREYERRRSQLGLPEL